MSSPAASPIRQRLLDRATRGAAARRFRGSGREELGRDASVRLLADALRDSPHPLAEDRPQHAPAVPERPQVARAVEPRKLEARHLGDPQARDGGLLAGAGLPPEAAQSKADPVEARLPSGVEAVAEVAVAGAEQHVHETAEEG